jgi:hypothetical protein
MYGLRYKPALLTFYIGLSSLLGWSTLALRLLIYYLTKKDISSDRILIH